MHYFTIFERSGADFEVVVEILRVVRDFPFPPLEVFLVVLAILKKIRRIIMPECQAFEIERIKII